MLAEDSRKVHDGRDLRCWKVVEVQRTPFEPRVSPTGNLETKYNTRCSPTLARRENTLIGATNDETERVNSAIDFTTGEEATIPEVAKAYKARGQPWMIVTDVSATPASTLEPPKR